MAKKDIKKELKKEVKKFGEYIGPGDAPIKDMAKEELIVELGRAYDCLDRVGGSMRDVTKEIAVFMKKM